MQTVGFIGLGNLGTPMAQNIQRAGFPMVVHDVREGAAKTLLEGGARSAATPGEVAAVSDVIMSCVPGPAEVEAITLGLDGILNKLNSGNVYVDLSTSRPSLIRKIGREFREKGAHVLDAPVLTSPVAALDRDVIVMPSGDKGNYPALVKSAPIEMLDRFKRTESAYDETVSAPRLSRAAKLRLQRRLRKCPPS